MSREFLSQITEIKLLSGVLSDKLFGTCATKPLTQLVQLPAFKRLSAYYKISGATIVIGQVLYELIDFRLRHSPTEDRVCNHTFKLFKRFYNKHILPFTQTIKTKGEYLNLIDYRAMTNAAIIWGKALYIAKQTNQPIQQISFQNLYDEQVQIIREENNNFQEGKTATPITDMLNQIVLCGLSLRI